MEHCPWIEKYRPTEFKDIVLDDTNKKILTNIIKNDYFPNLLFYGPPGTGKTTTIINLIKSYQDTHHQKRQKQFMIHLNASDDRGIDIIRNQIYQFVNIKTLFGHGTKFVSLDEVYYMTKNAQYAAGSQLLRNSKVMARLNTLKNKLNQQIEITRDRVAQEYAVIAFQKAPTM